MAKIITNDYSLELIYPPCDEMKDDELLNFCLQNRDLPIERDENKQLLFLPPTAPYYSNKKAEFLGVLGLWNRQKKTGVVFDSSGGFFLPDSSMRCADATWISLERWNALTNQQRKGFAYITPDFIMELASPFENTSDLKTKMEKWRSNGVRLGWLIDLKNETVFIYRIDGTVSKVEGFDNTLSGEDVLNGFEFELSNLR